MEPSTNFIEEVLSSRRVPWAPRFPWTLLKWKTALSAWNRFPFRCSSITEPVGRQQRTARTKSLPPGVPGPHHFLRSEHVRCRHRPGGRQAAGFVSGSRVPTSQMAACAVLRRGASGPQWASDRPVPCAFPRHTSGGSMPAKGPSPLTPPGAFTETRRTTTPKEIRNEITD